MPYVHARRAPVILTLALGAAASMFALPALAAAPKISGTPITTATVGVDWSFQPTASDADKNPLTFSIVNKPGFASFDAKTGRVWGNPAAEHARTWSGIVISVTDGTTKVSLPAFALVVKPNPNKSPVVTGTPVTKATVGTLYSFQPTAKDPEGKAVTFNVRNKPSWATFSTTTGRLSGTPAASNVGTFSNIIVQATDGVTRASLPTFAIVVTAAGGSTNSPPTISGSPLKSVSVGTAYTFQPTAADANKDPLTFSITNKPSWASFSTSTGKLSGTPTATNVGTTSNIVIKVSDGKASASLAAFSLAVTQIATGSVTVTWTPPTRNTNGSTLTNLAGYRIRYGQSSGSLTKSVQISTPGMASYVIENISPGTWYFSMTSYTSTGAESSPSTPVQHTVQ